MQIKNLLTTLSNHNLNNLNTRAHSHQHTQEERCLPETNQEAAGEGVAQTQKQICHKGGAQTSGRGAGKGSGLVV